MIILWLPCSSLRMILYNYDILQPFDELFEVAIHAAAKFTTEYKASETADEVDGVCDSANEVCALKTKQITFVGHTSLISIYIHVYHAYMYTMTSCWTHFRIAISLFFTCTCNGLWKSIKSKLKKMKIFQIIVLLLSHLNVIIVDLGNKLPNSRFIFTVVYPWFFPS